MITTDITLTGMTIDWDTADRITALNLAKYRDNMQEALNKAATGEGWLHEDDEVHNRAMIHAINFVLKDFGHGD
jgi:hypothetical protein